MLVLSRKIGEEVRIGQDITVTVIKLSQGKVVLGFDAPTKVNIVRSELLEKCPTCNVPMYNGTYDVCSVLICPKCQHRVKVDNDGELARTPD